MATNTIAPHYATATYTEQRLPQYLGNPLIEAIPPCGTEEDVMKKLLSLPHFGPEQREWSDAERIQMIAQLASFMVPMSRHVQLAYAVDAMMRHGYVGRIPHTVTSTALFRKLHEQQAQGKTFPTNGAITAQISSALIGMSGTGKTTTIKRLFSHIPEVIHHPDYGIYQVPYLHIEMPYDGASVTGLAFSIFRKLDLLFPEASYSEQFAKGSRLGAETLMNHAARLLIMHSVGILVVDEVQNLENSPSNRKGLMTLLVSASNELGVPILFVGTSKARNLLSMSFRQARRSCGYGVPVWENLTKGTPQAPGDWEMFAQALLTFQWVRNPVPVTPYLMDQLYFHSQGIMDVAIQLVATAQVRAIMDGSETLTAELIESVAKTELSMLAPMIKALRNGEPEALQQLGDIQPLSLAETIRMTQLQYEGRKVDGINARPGDASFKNMMSNALEALGFSPAKADQLTQSVADAGVQNALEGVKEAIVTATKGKKRSKGTKVANNVSANENPYAEAVNLRPGDYRNAFHRPEGVSIFEQLGKLGMLPDMDVLFSV